MNTANLITLRVWGDFACFTRPEMKVERVSYPVMTPSAARGILEAVFWEPQMYYLIDAIRVVKRGQWISIRRNEVTRVISLDSAKTWMHSPEKTSPIQAGGGAEDGTQRNMLALQDVEYLITAEVRLTPLSSDRLLSRSWTHLIDLIAIDDPWKRPRLRKRMPQRQLVRSPAPAPDRFAPLRTHRPLHRQSRRHRARPGASHQHARHHRRPHP